MKSYRILILALSIFAIGFSSCKKDADTSFANSVSATIDGIGYYSDSIVSIGSAEIMNFTSAVGKEKIILHRRANAHGRKRAGAGNEPIHHNRPRAGRRAKTKSADAGDFKATERGQGFKRPGAEGFVHI